MQPLVSVIMPAYNTEKYIAESIQSVLDQSYTNWELLVVDDGSTDQTAEIVRAFAAKDGRVKYLFQQNGGQSKARNTGIQNAGGSLLAFLDSDDVWLPEKLQLQMRTMVATKVDVVYSNGFVIYEPGAASGPSDFPIIAGSVEGPKMFDLLLLLNFIPVQSVVLRREVFDKAGPFDESLLCEDYDLWLKIAASGASFYGMSEKLIKYRRHPTATTHENSKLLQPMLRVVSRHIETSALDDRKKRARVRRLYRDLIAALIEEGKLPEAREMLNEFAAWDKSGVVTSLQKLLLKLSPGSFNVISRECLYRAEWHLAKLTGRAVDI